MDDLTMSRHIAAICAHCGVPMVGRESCPFAAWHDHEVCAHGRALITAAREVGEDVDGGAKCWRPLAQLRAATVYARCHLTACGECRNAVSR